MRSVTKLFRIINNQIPPSSFQQLEKHAIKYGDQSLKTYREVEDRYNHLREINNPAVRRPFVTGPLMDSLAKYAEVHFPLDCELNFLVPHRDIRQEHREALLSEFMNSDISGIENAHILMFFGVRRPGETPVSTGYIAENKNIIAGIHDQLIKNSLLPQEDEFKTWNDDKKWLWLNRVAKAVFKAHRLGEEFAPLISIARNMDEKNYGYTEFGEMSDISEVLKSDFELRSTRVNINPGKRLTCGSLAWDKPGWLLNIAVHESTHAAQYIGVHTLAVKQEVLSLQQIAQAKECLMGMLLHKFDRGSNYVGQNHEAHAFLVGNEVASRCYGPDCRIHF